MNLFFILIQGPYIQQTGNLVKELRKNLKDTRIVLSCYDEHIDESVLNIADVKRSPDPGTIITPPKGRPSNLVRQATTINRGCEGYSEKWVLKIRSDLEIVNQKKFLSFIEKFRTFINQERDLKLICLNTGCFDIFCYYEMPLHFNDLFFICRTETLIKNTAAVIQIDEQDLIGFGDLGVPKNYRHKKKYNLRFHTQQMIHFGSALSKGYWLKFCCDMDGSGKIRHIIWVGKYLMVFKMQDIGIRSTKVGYPSVASNFISVSPFTIKLYRNFVNAKNMQRVGIYWLIRLNGYFRYSIFRTIKIINLLRQICIKICKLFFLKN